MTLFLWLTISSFEQERDNNVYMAKLAEQAERYDGKSPSQA
jgi:hypothetical protein